MGSRESSSSLVLCAFRIVCVRGISLNVWFETCVLTVVNNDDSLVTSCACSSLILNELRIQWIQIESCIVFIFFLPLCLIRSYRSCSENLFAANSDLFPSKMSKLCSKMIPMTVHSVNN